MFLIVTSKDKNTHNKEDQKIITNKIVIKILLDDCTNDVFPYILNRTNFSLSFHRIRNCEVISSPLLLYIMTIPMCVIMIVIWIISLIKSRASLNFSQILIILMIILKSYENIIAILNMNNCSPDKSIDPYIKFASSIKFILKPIFEGLLIYLILSLSFVNSIQI